METEILARIQFAFTVAFHYIYPPLSIGLGLILVIMEGMYLKTGLQHYKHMTQFWIKIFALIFGIGVATGIVMEFEFGTNWAAYSKYVGDIFGSALAAEGIFALNEIEKIKHIFLIETDNEWIEALKETYKPWLEKITIINKFVSNIDDDTNVRLDTYFAAIEKIDLLKIDVDGAEQDLLNGADKTVSNKVKKLAICTYHKTNDNRDFTAYLLSKNYSLSNSHGYMLFYFDPNFEAPYFRRGLIKAEKK